MDRSSMRLQQITVYLCSLVLCATILISSGCSKGSSLVPATGKITVNGKPANGAQLMFHPEDPGTTLIPSAVAGEDGTFSLQTNMEPGIPVGKYKVTVSWPDPAVQPTEKQKMMGNFEPGPDLLKGKYILKTNTPLSVEITSSTQAIPPFELSAGK